MDRGGSFLADDVRFLVQQMHRPAWPERLVKRKEEPARGKYRMPAEPHRTAVMLLAQLKQEESQRHHHHVEPKEKITPYEASRFMRFENGEEPLRKEPIAIKRQREFYEHVPALVNRDDLKSPDLPVYRYELRDYVRTRWIVHDMAREEGRLLRCEWYQEHLQWGTGLDQLSLAHVLARREVLRRIGHEEPDDHAIKSLSQQISTQKLLTDMYEWHALQTPANKLVPDNYGVVSFPYEIPEDTIHALARLYPAVPQHPDVDPLYVRIISDKIMGITRRAWNDALKHAKKKS